MRSGFGALYLKGRRLNSTIDLAHYSRKDRRKIPVIINNFNRYSMLSGLIDKLLEAELSNLIILDNNSTYLPLIDYYSVTPAKVVYLRRNIGYLALWESGFISSIGNSPFIYTDPDVVPDDNCPIDFIDVLFESLICHPQLDKVGLALRLDDLPNSSPVTSDVIRHEQMYWQRRFSKNLYQASIDTTLALYRPGRCGGYWLNAGRTEWPYVARHMPWYFDPARLDNEETFYRSQVLTETYWSSSD